MDKKAYLAIAIVAVVLVVLIVQAFQISDINKKLSTTGLVAAGGSAAASGAINMSGWTDNEKMNYEHHGTIPARLQQGTSSGSASGGSAMVGGC